MDVPHGRCFAASAALPATLKIHLQLLLMPNIDLIIPIVPTASGFIYIYYIFFGGCSLVCQSSDRNMTQFVIFNLLNYHKMRATQFILFLDMRAAVVDYYYGTCCCCCFFT